VAAARRTFGLGSAPAILVQPPDRPAAAKPLSVWRAGLERVAARRPGLRVVVTEADRRGDFEGWPGRPVLLASRGDALALDTRRALARGCEAALVEDPAETLWLAPHGVAAVVAREPGWWPQRPQPALLDRAAGTRAVPVLAGLACRPGPIAAALIGTLERPEPQREAGATALSRLGSGGEDPGIRAARAVLALL
jgi:lipid-A-disaccharide synthase